MSSEQDTSTYRNNRALFSMRGVVLEQRERTRKSSKADIERFTEESEFKIISLESQIDTLIELRDREHAYVAALRHLISPIHTLPVELLAEIFDLTIRDYTHVQDAHRISQVCSDWRQLVHGTPRLWTRPIQIHLQKRRTDDREQAYLDGLMAWLTRSAPLAVPVSVLADADIYHHMPEQILRTAPRWRSLHFDDVEISFLSHLAEARLDNLEELDLGERNFNLDLHDADDFEKDDLASFTTVPRLQKLRMHNYSDTLSIFVPWAQLTNLILGAHCSNIALDILAQCTNLSQATVSTTGRFSRPEAKQSIPALNHLRVLTLPFFGSAENAGKAMLFLDHLPTPALQKLTLDFGDTVDPRWSEPHFISFQQQAPNITCLELQYSELTSAELIIAIRHVSFPHPPEASLLL
ncbi:F-box domain-containing protein [Mycena sanguinolenta]|uniref:F-box domain-containing protein n=1 Tax=Mycena sanguinolenta TaxID=230812 RepID=A0A8H6X779_9AGAR|nr:F-box domain-containing protein [Mycena sanguinolenta]